MVERNGSVNGKEVEPEGSSSEIRRTRTGVVWSFLFEGRPRRFCRWCQKNGRQPNNPELIPLIGIFSLGVLILVLHLLTWGSTIWEETDQLVRSSAVVKERYIHSRPNRRGKIFYRPEVLIVYDVGNLPHIQRAYDRTTLTEDQGFMYDQAAVEEMLVPFVRGKTVPCWYVQGNPDRVVLKRDRNYWGWIFLIIPVVLISFGAVGLFLKVRGRLRSEEQRALSPRRKVLYPMVPDSREINASPGVRLAFRLPLALFPMFHFLFVLALIMLWNGLAWGTFIYLFSVRNGWFGLLSSLLFGLIFCVPGLIFLPRILNLFRRAFAVGTTILEISDHPVIPARKHRLTLIQNGRLHAQSFMIYIVGEELARYRQGTDTLTNCLEVYRQILFQKKELQLAAGQSTTEDFFLRLPCGVMHSMVAEHNEIRWKIVVEIIVDEKTDFRRECPIVVLPYTIRSEIYH